MSWVDKAHKKNKMHKMIDEAMKSEKYQKARKADIEQAALKGLARFIFIALLYLEMVFRCKKKAFLKFLDFVKKTLEEIGEDPEFLKASNEYFKKTYELDVMDCLGMAFVEEDE